MPFLGVPSECNLLGTLLETHLSKPVRAFAFLLLCPWAVAQPSSGAVTIRDIRAAPDFEQIEPADPAVTRSDLSPLRDETEARLRGNLPKLIGALTQFERGATDIPADLAYGYERERNPILAVWRAEGVNGRALALLDIAGALRVRVVANSNSAFGIASEATVDDARNVLALLWGGRPQNEPRRMLRRSWEWHGPDSMTDNDATSASVRFNAEPKGNWLPTEIFVKAGSPFESWENLTADIFARTSGLLTRRQAMAQAIQQIDSGKVHNCPADISGTSFRAGLRGRGGWQFEVETTAEPAKRFLFIGIEDRTGQVSSTGFSAQPSNLPTSGNCETAEEVRSWPEYEIAVARARADDKTFAAACDEVRPKVEAAIAAVRPEFKDRAHNLIFAQRGSRPGAGVANYVDVEHDRVPLFTFSFDYDRSTPRLTTALMIVPPSGNEPDPRDEQAWKSFASSTIEKVLGVKPTAHRQQFTSSHRPVQTDEENSGMTVDSMSSNWTADVNGREVTLPQVCRIERYLNGNYYFYWNSNAPLPEIDAALAAMRAGLPVSEEQAGKIAVKAAGLRYTDLSLDVWYISHATLQLPAFGGLEARSTHARTSGASPTWNIRLRESDKSRRYITAAIDARSGDVLDVEAKTTPVE